MTIAERDLEQPLEHEIDPALQEKLLKYPGKWVAMTRSEIIAIDDVAEVAYRAARDQGYESPILYRVPESATTYFI